MNARCYLINTILAVSSIFHWQVVPAVARATPGITARHEHDVMRSHIVPADQLTQAQVLNNPLPGSPSVLKQGQSIYEGKCASCHGTKGGGNGPVAAIRTPAPRNFRNKAFWQNRTEGEIFWVIKNGIPTTAMHAFKNTLNDEEIWTLVNYLQTFNNRRNCSQGVHCMVGGKE